MTPDCQPIGVLALAARDCAMFGQVRRLVEWVGDGKPITPKQVLRPIDVPGVAQALGITAPDRVVTAARISALHRPWKVALAVGGLRIMDGRAVAVPMAEWFSDNEAVLERWLTALAVTFAAGTASEDEFAAAEFARILLTSLADGPASSADLLGRRAFEALDVDDFFLISPFFGAYRGREDPHGAMVDVLIECGAATQQGPRVMATPLGLWAAREMQARIPEPVSPDLSAAELIVRLTETEEPWYAAQPWLEGRKPLQAARDLLQAAATASPLQRITAIELVDALGEPADAAWDEALAITNLAAHAREVLARSGNAVARKKEDARWLAAEYAAAALAEHGPDEAWSCLDKLLPGKEFASLIRAVEGSDHPAATELTEALNAFIASGEKPTSTRVCQLKISLKQMRSPIWRRVLVPAPLRLDLLDAVIRLVMEWDGDHLHAFWVGRERYMTSSWRRCSISKPTRPTPSVWQQGRLAQRGF